MRRRGTGRQTDTSASPNSRGVVTQPRPASPDGEAQARGQGASGQWLARARTRQLCSWPRECLTCSLLGASDWPRSPAAQGWRPGPSRASSTRQAQTAWTLGVNEGSSPVLAQPVAGGAGWRGPKQRNQTRDTEVTWSQSSTVGDRVGVLFITLPAGCGCGSRGWWTCDMGIPRTTAPTPGGEPGKGRVRRHPLRLRARPSREAFAFQGRAVSCPFSLQVPSPEF